MLCKLKKVYDETWKLFKGNNLYIGQYFCTFKSALKLHFPVIKQVKNLFPPMNDFVRALGNIFTWYCFDLQHSNLFLLLQTHYRKTRLFLRFLALFFL